ncbi:glycosyltransferase [Mangrovimonas sp. CR14]|uniref:glycosyltransferase n=1 Tax=Mangrovimonas sp. CR14 TaxID=2706120 RepID=UPI00141F69CD|nr:glycosyltransferase [Mangrovimonas sp. CR14]NIK92180.1 glycosyltransferase [Mangrovimonas sp. CR14]
MELQFSFIIPIYDRPQELEELLMSLCELHANAPFEIVVVEDGSTISSKGVVNEYAEKLNISYYYKENSGPGDSRNYGMKRAKGNYFLILDSDCIIPKHYLVEVERSLADSFVHCFGGPDAAHETFSNLQKAINFSMTSFLTTGGIRGGNESVDKFQPRSFNMGLSKEAFLACGGFGTIHPGEDPDLTLRLWNLGYETRLIPSAFVYHKRRISWKKFYQQVRKFGLVRPILNHWHPTSKKITYWFPSLFVLGFMVSLILVIFKIYWLFFCYMAYLGIGFAISLWNNKSFTVAILSVPAILVQFVGYGFGFLESTIKIGFLKRNPEKSFPKLFFKH